MDLPILYRVVDTDGWPVRPDATSEMAFPDLATAESQRAHLDHWQPESGPWRVVAYVEVPTYADVIWDGMAEQVERQRHKAIDGGATWQRWSRIAELLHALRVAAQVAPTPDTSEAPR